MANITPYSYKRGLLRFLTAERQENIDALDDLSAEDWAAIISLGPDVSMLISEDSGVTYAYASTPTAATAITMTAGSTNATVEPTGSAAFALTFTLPLLPATDSNFLFRVDYDKGTHGAALIIGGETVTGAGILHFVWSGSAWVVFSGSTAMTVPESTVFITHTIVDGDSGNTLALTLPTGAANIGRALTLVIASTTSAGTASKTNILGVYGGTLSDVANGTYFFRCTAEGAWMPESNDYVVATLDAGLTAHITELGTLAGIQSGLSSLEAKDAELLALEAVDAELLSLAAKDTELLALENVDAELLTLAGIQSGLSSLEAKDAELLALEAVDAELLSLAAKDTELLALENVDAELLTLAGIQSGLSSLEAKDTELLAIEADRAIDSANMTIVGTLPENALAHYDEANAQHEVAGAHSTTVVGANNSGGAITGAAGAVKRRGKVTLKAFSPIADGQKLKSYHSGYTGMVLSYEMSGTESFDAAAGAFTNQPTDDAVELISDSASDVAVDVKIYGHDAGVLISETNTLTGTGAVETTEQHWDDICAVFVTSGTLVGTLTVRKKTGPATICTIAPAGTDAGVVEAANELEALQYCLTPAVVADGGSSEYVVVIGTDNDGNAQEEILQLNGATSVNCADWYATIDRICIGDPATVTVSVLRCDSLDEAVVIVGRALEAATGQDDTFSALLT